MVLFLAVLLTGSAKPPSNNVQNNVPVSRENLLSRHEIIKDAHPKRVVFAIPEDKPPKKRFVQKALQRPIRRFGNCVWYLRSLGYYVPQNPKIAARTLPVRSSELPPEGKVVVIVTYDSRLGHVAAAVNKNGLLITVADSAFGAGRIVPLSVYKGYI